MGFFKISAILLVAILQWKADCTSVRVLNCPPNSRQAVVSDCEITCGNVGPGIPRVCNKRGRITCKCDEGLLPQTGTDGESVQCVSPKDCNVTCSDNMQYVHNATACQPTCANPGGSEVCYAGRFPQCVCNKGYLLSGQRCVKPDECNP
ncbi:serine protease inhibitor swm-1-like [Engystomops pustulosus]|uniref:serine protease inhibitor swm-1-like n=1 Tax=Engystomops pustulosus TaxID=76066 RepID=UPI003AFA8399